MDSNNNDEEAYSDFIGSADHIRSPDHIRSASPGSGSDPTPRKPKKKRTKASNPPLDPDIEITPKPYPKSLDDHIMKALGADDSSGNGNSLNAKQKDQTKNLAPGVFKVDNESVPFTFYKDDYDKLVEAGIKEQPENNVMEEFFETAFKTNVRFVLTCPCKRQNGNGNDCGFPMAMPRDLWTSIFLDKDSLVPFSQDLPDSTQLWQGTWMNTSTLYRRCQNNNSITNYRRTLSKHLSSFPDHLQYFKKMSIFSDLVDRGRQRYEDAKLAYLSSQCQKLEAINLPVKRASPNTGAKDYGLGKITEEKVHDKDKDWLEFLSNARRIVSRGALSVGECSVLIQILDKFDMRYHADYVCLLCSNATIKQDSHGMMRGNSRCICPNASCTQILCRSCVRKRWQMFAWGATCSNNEIKQQGINYAKCPSCKIGTLDDRSIVPMDGRDDLKLFHVYVCDVLEQLRKEVPRCLQWKAMMHERVSNALRERERTVPRGLIISQWEYEYEDIIQRYWKVEPPIDPRINFFKDTFINRWLQIFEHHDGSSFLDREKDMMKDIMKMKEDIDVLAWQWLSSGPLKPFPPDVIVID